MIGFLADVVNALDLDAIYLSYNEKDGRGMSAYAPAMMLRVLLYGYATGIYSSRKIQTKTYDDVAFRFLSADEHPDHSTLAEFRKRHLMALAGLFMQALQLCAQPSTCSSCFGTVGRRKRPEMRWGSLFGFPNLIEPANLADKIQAIRNPKAPAKY
jgi:hypothetical protein